MQGRTDEQRRRNLTWILVCTNERTEHAACAGAGGQAVLAEIQQWLRDRDLFWTEAAVVETTCLGLCSEDGTAVAFQPADRWFSDVTPADVPDLLGAEIAVES